MCFGKNLRSMSVLAVHTHGCPASGLTVAREQLGQAPSIVRKETTGEWIPFEWAIREETVPQFCWWPDHSGPG
jgi:hypothetical protein